MLVFGQRLETFHVQATDGELGKVKDIYFDEENWVIRYLVIDTLKWLPGRKVLLSPIAFDHIDFENEKVNILETKEKIKESPPIDEHKPVSRQYEARLSVYYSWPLYWGYYEPERYWGNYNTPHQLKEQETMPEVFDPEEVEQTNKLRSAKELKGEFTGYKINTIDGEIGNVADFLIDDENWKIRYFVVGTGNWLPGKYVVLSVDWIQDISWKDSSVTVDLTKDQIENGPFFELGDPFTKKEEKILYESYGKNLHL
ncbi:PRC-barrel domain-containing protein [Evansella tamaricis]|uniref:PRC-barrel domain-containing protein n=1 Tax=Evansella tamaricis TaxID=2069301 RepID=A0ABS6JH50_9BACI|nr:PRC-barrel domain-containing protein [Evansella tamaricis]MBU9712177.1 PRC-barrel domain-containing protein [Evansella tamaricis]